MTASSDLLPQVRYYDRTSTTVLNAYAGPDHHALPLGADARGWPISASRRAPDHAVERRRGDARRGRRARRALAALGPRVGADRRRSGSSSRTASRDCITIDMGGTSFDAALVTGGEPLVMTDGVVDRWRIALPMIDIHTIGAGGGSIARVDAGGMLQVGPQSAGAKPGPACYGRGGALPTTTDADLVLGFLADEQLPRRRHAARPRCGRARDRRARRAAARPLASRRRRPASTTSSTSRWRPGCARSACGAASTPRDFPLVVAGGAGPVHAAAIAAELEIPLLVVPRESSIFCAAGMLMSDFKHDFVRAYKTPLADGGRRASARRCSPRWRPRAAPSWRASASDASRS